jgi:hypothetical protein
MHGALVVVREMPAQDPAYRPTQLRGPSQAGPTYSPGIACLLDLASAPAVKRRGLSRNCARCYFLPPFPATGPSWPLRNDLVASSMPSANFRWESISCSVKL